MISKIFLELNLNRLWLHSNSCSQMEFFQGLHKENLYMDSFGKIFTWIHQGKSLHGFFQRFLQIFLEIYLHKFLQGLFLTFLPKNLYRDFSRDLPSKISTEIPPDIFPKILLEITEKYREEHDSSVFLSACICRFFFLFQPTAYCVVKYA